MPTGPTGNRAESRDGTASLQQLAYLSRSPQLHNGPTVQKASHES